MATLVEIERLCRDYSVARAALREKVEALNDEIERLKRQRLPQIRKAVELASERQRALRLAIEEAQDIFQKPKTQIFHGIEVGFRKGKGTISWEDEEQVVKLIHRYYPDEWENYIKVTEKPLKAALAQLSVAELKKLGITVIETGDEVVIKATDTEIDKLVNALLKDELKEAGAA
ncbi:hypothetical protein A45J_0385 [hot springs metagenome]|uniref:Host-nuclease inhibitor protein Gam n=1 Tax=hot springs metagenome TaxID=433727 RepID=A0A5J4L1M9_9ZZZZ